MRFVLLLSLLLVGCGDTTEFDQARAAAQLRLMENQKKNDDLQNGLIAMCIQKGGVPIISVFRTELKDCKFPVFGGTFVR
jgi:hypothetical protein